MNISVNQYKESLLQWIWQELRFRCAGKMLLEFLYYLSVLPSFYLLGELVHSKKLKRESHTAWIKGRQPIPASIKKTYEQAGFVIKKGHHKLGIAHQYKRYCRIGECRSCEVFKNSIRA